MCPPLYYNCNRRVKTISKYENYNQQTQIYVCVKNETTIKISIPTLRKRTKYIKLARLKMMLRISYQSSTRFGVYRIVYYV